MASGLCLTGEPTLHPAIWRLAALAPANNGHNRPFVLVLSETDPAKRFRCKGERGIDIKMTKQRWSESNGVPHSATTPSPEVEPPTERRARSAADKLRILQAYEACPVGSPDRGALLRREGIYTSQISKWRKLRDQGRLGTLNAPRRGPKPAAHALLRDEVERLRQENARLQTRLTRAEAIIEVQKKLAHLLGTTSPTPPVDER